jgi:ATP-binding cassette, subfamily B, bacterial HlyB/CyaB
VTEQNVVQLEQGTAAPGAPAVDGRYVSMLACLVTIARQQGLFLSEHQLILDNQLSEDRVAPQELAFIAERVGMRARTVRLSAEDLVELRKACPAIVTLKSGGAMVLQSVHNNKGEFGRVELVDPHGEPGSSIFLDFARFEEAWSGEVVLVRRVYEIANEEQPFSMSFIAGLVFRERRIMRDLGLSAMLLSFLQLAPIIYYRTMSSDVITHYSMNTYIFLTVALAWIIVFTTVLTYLRGYLQQIVSTRIDARLNEYIFDRVLSLPIDYFERTQVGETAHTIHEAEKIRTFLVVQLFGTLLDSTTLLFFLPVMFYISWLSSLVVLSLLGLTMAAIVLTLPALRELSGRAIGARIKRGSFLYQTLSGMRTVKSLALEPRQRARWDSLTADVARKEYELGQKANSLRAIVYPLEQLAMSGAFAVGVFQALYTHNPVLVGYLYMFLMLSQRVVAPLVQMSKLVEQYDEARIAVELVKRLVNRAPEENAGDHGVRKPLLGHVSFSSLRFKYSGSQNFALDGVSFEVPIGTTLGLVGRSGSGKTTVTRLLQRLHSEYEGVIKVDGVDLREYDLPHLRRSLGVVLQENFLFSGTIRENIVAAKPSATFDEVVNACRLAGAEEFIDRLPRGYDTYIYEGSPNLSGGQRQRLAIARALIVDPRILILDEATSALDPDSEAIVNDNIKRIAEGRTMLVISHRLSSLVSSDAILVLERGKVADLGPHAELLERCDIYRNLWNQQNRHTNAAAKQFVRGPSRVS